MSYIPQQEVIISTLNSTTTPLAAGGTFTGTAEDVSAFATVTLIVKSDTASAVDGLQFQFSPDGTNWDVVKAHNAEAGVGHEMALLVTGQFFRLVYINSTVAQTYFRAQILIHPNKDKEVSYALDGHIDSTAFAPLARSILVGRTSGGLYNNAGVSAENNLQVEIHGPTTAFGEVLVAESTPVIQADFVYNINTALVNTTVTGTGTITQANAMAVVSTGANALSTALLSTRRYIKYRPGQGGDIRLTAIFTAGIAGSEQIAGAGSPTNGYFFGYNGTTFGVVRVQNSVYNWTAQTAWNVDTMDGSGNANNPSGVLLDQTKGNVYNICFQWLGFGAIVYAIEDPNTGQFTTVHRDQYGNANTVPSVYIPSFPVHYHVKNTTNTSAIVIKTSSCAGSIQGRVELLGPRNALNNTKAAVTTTLTNIITIRNKATFQGVANQVPVILAALSGAIDGNKPGVVEIVLNATIGGVPAYTDFSINTSVVDYDTAGTTVTGGTSKGIFVLAKTDGFFEILKDLDITLFAGDTLTIAAKATSTTTDVTVGPIWIEDF